MPETIKDTLVDFVQNTTDLVHVVDTDGYLKFVNSSWAIRLGYTEKEVLQTPIFNYLHIDDQEHCQTIFNELLSGKNNYAGEMSFIDKNGEKVICEASISCSYNKAGEFIQSIGVFRDVTGLRKAELLNEVLHQIAIKSGEANISIYGLCNYIQLQIGRLMDVTEFYICQSDDPDSVTFVHLNDSTEGQSLPFTRKRGNGLSEYVIQTGKPLLLKGTETLQFQKDHGLKIYGEPAKCWIGAPLMSSGKSMGVIACQSYTTEDLYNQSHLDLLAAVGNQIGLWIEQKKTQQEIQEYANFFSTSMELMCLTHTDGYFKKVNALFTSILGHSEEELLSQQFYNFIHPDDLQATEKEVERLVQGVRTIDFINRYRCKDGSYKWISWAATPDTEAGLIYAMGRDVTSLKEAEKALVDSEGQLRSLMENAPYIIIRINEEYQVEYINRSDNNYTPRDVVGTSVFAFVNPNDRSAVKRILDSVFETGRSDSFKTTALDRNNREVIIRVSIGPVNTGLEKTTAAIAIIQDVTVEETTQLKIETSFKELKLIDAINQAIISNSSLEKIFKMAMKALSELADIQGGRLYLYDSDSNELKLEQQLARKSILQKLEKQLKTKSRKAVPKIKAGTFFHKSVVGQEFIAIRSKEEIGAIIAEHSDTGLYKKIAGWIRDLMNIKTFLFIPIIADQKPVGLITMHAESELKDAIIESVKRYSYGINAALINVIAEQKSQEQGQFIDNVLNRLPADIAVFDPQHRYLFTNGTAVQDDETRAWLVGKDDFDYCRYKGISDEKAKMRRAYFKSAKKTRSEVEWVEVHNKNEEEQYILRKFHPLFEKKELKYMLGYGVDITERVEAEKAKERFTQQLEMQVAERTEKLLISQTRLEEALAKEQELGKLKSRFVSTASHQFRTPMAIIQSNTELLNMVVQNVDDGKKAQLERSTMRIAKEVKRMTNLMDEVLILGKVTSGQMSADLKSVRIIDLCSELIEQFEAIQNDGRTVKYVQTGTPRELMIDAQLMSHALGNLLSNAFKYSAHKNPELSLAFGKAALTIKITDYGIGIPPEDQENLFQPFHRAENVRDIEGTGLGLTIAKEYIELNGGELKVQSEISKGSTFTITFPLNSEDKAA